MKKHILLITFLLSSNVFSQLTIKGPIQCVAKVTGENQDVILKKFTNPGRFDLHATKIGKYEIKLYHIMIGATPDVAIPQLASFLKWPGQPAITSYLPSPTKTHTTYFSIGDSKEQLGHIGITCRLID